MPMPEIESRVVECSSVDEAKAKGAEIWGIQPDDIDATVISEDKKLFGWPISCMPFSGEWWQLSWPCGTVSL